MAHPRYTPEEKARMRSYNSLNQAEKTVVDISTENPSLTNAEVADKVGVRVAFVRDIRNEHVDTSTYDADSGPSSDSKSSGSTTPFEKNTEAESIGDVTATEGFNNQPQTQHRLKHIFTSLPDPVVETEFVEDEPIVRRVNAAFEDLFEYDDNEIVGQQLLDFVFPEGSQDGAVERTRRSDDESHTERIVTRKTATGVRPFLHRHVPYEHNGNQYAFEVYSDVTGQKRRELELQRRIQQLEEKKSQLADKSQQLEQFASILSHDLRNPINIVEGYVDQLDNEENEQEVAVIERALGRMNSLIEDTLTLKNQSQPVNELAYHSISTLAESAWEVVDTDDSELRIVDRFEVACDKERMARLFENLFRNAIEHNNDPVIIRIGIHDTLTTSTRGDTQKAFHVADDGCGIPEDKRDEMFEIGQTTTRDGTGLGLPIIKRIAEAHRWNVSVVESFDGGAQFVFTNVNID